MPPRKQTSTGITRFELDGEVLEIDMNHLTFGEMEEAEAYFDSPLERVNWETGRGMLLIAYLAKKRKDPKTTLDDLRGVEVSALKEVSAPKRPTKQTAASSGRQS